MDNLAIAELLSRSAEVAEGHRQRAYRRAAGAALVWPVEITDLIEQGRSLQELFGVGKGIDSLIRRWLDEGSKVPEPPPLRRGFSTMARALAALDTAPDGWDRSQLRADLQMHTGYSDGKEDLPTMVAAAAERGYDYVAVTDHSGGQRIPRGMDAEAMGSQRQEIEELNEAGGIRVLHSIEMNLRPDGSGDADPLSVAGLDLVLGAFHSQLRGTGDQTDRYLAALQNPLVHVLAHPQGRRYGMRVGLNADWPRVFAEAEALDKALEIDATPQRQDLSIELLTVVRDFDVRISIGTDAHSIRELDFIELATGAAVAAGIERARILNFAPVAEVLEWTSSLKERAIAALE